MQFQYANPTTAITDLAEKLLDIMKCISKDTNVGWIFVNDKIFLAVFSMVIWQRKI